MVTATPGLAQVSTRVVDTGGTPIPQATITIDVNNEETQATGDDNGFAFVQTDPGPGIITVFDSNGNPVYENFQVDLKADTTTFLLFPDQSYFDLQLYQFNLDNVRTTQETCFCDSCILLRG